MRPHFLTSHVSLLIAASAASASSPITHHSSLLAAIREVETGGQPRGGRDTRGDSGRSLGPYQVQRSYWRDAGIPGRYDQVRDPSYARDVIEAYWRKHCPAALRRGDLQTLARTHNGGPAGPHKRSTIGYWHRVRRQLTRDRGEH